MIVNIYCISGLKNTKKRFAVCIFTRFQISKETCLEGSCSNHC